MLTLEVLFSPVVLLVDLGAGAVLVVPKVVARGHEHVVAIFDSHCFGLVLRVELKVLIC